MENLKFNLVSFISVKNADIDSILKLYRDAGWWKEEYDPKEIPRLIESSFIFIIGLSKETQEIIAMGRVISDGVYGIIQDLCVLKKYRGKGIGKLLIDFMIDSAKNAGLFRIILVAEPGTEFLYQKSGFISDRNQIFLLHTYQE